STSQGNITGGGISVPLNESSISPSTGVEGNQSLVPATDESQVSNTTATDSASTTATGANLPFSINTDMMQPVLYLIDPQSDKIITVDLSQNPLYPNGSMPLHTMITPQGNKAFLSTMSSDTAPATILALDIGNIDWQAGKADVSISNVINISEAGSTPQIPDIKNHTTNKTQPIIKKLWIPNNVQIHGPTLHPGGKYAYFTQWTDNIIRVLDVNNGSLAASDPIQIGNATEWLHGVFFNPAGNKALSPHYFFEGNHLHLFDVNNDTGELTNPVEITLGNQSAYAAFPHFVNWINNTHAITSTQQLGPTSATPNNTKIIGPSVWLINIENVNSQDNNNGGASQQTSAATMIIPFSNNTQGNGIFKPASDTTILGNKLYVAEEDSMDESIDNQGQVSIWDITNLQNPQLIKRLSPGQGLPENFQLGHTIYATPDGKFVYVEDWNSGQLVKIDTSVDEVINVFNKENSGFMMPHGGFITGQLR
ncbi:MAG: hypothetical protein M3162_07845, partial [Thermoproteota archaeon]|nr:hypothetical protein [Thermoproteota archaeon]